MGVLTGEAFVNRATTVFAAVLWAAALCGCSTDIGVNDFKYACEKHSDCGEGYECQPGVGCVRFPEKHDGGGTDAAGHKDAGVDAGRDAGHDGGLDGGGDAGHGDAGFVIRFSRTANAAAGAGSSDSYMLKSATGWSTGPKWSVGSFKLKMGNPYETGQK